MFNYTSLSEVIVTLRDLKTEPVSREHELDSAVRYFDSFLLNRK
jgi:hypothetical protein